MVPLPPIGIGHLTGVTVLDVEVVRLTPDSNPAAYEALFDVGALLGARFVNVLPDDPDLGRLRDSFHILARVAVARLLSSRTGAS